MPINSIVAEPHEIASLKQAFEDAWQNLQARGAVDPLRLAAQRERLAYIVIGLRKLNPEVDVTELAVAQFLGDEPLIEKTVDPGVSPKVD